MQSLIARPTDRVISQSWRIAHDERKWIDSPSAYGARQDAGQVLASRWTASVDQPREGISKTDRKRGDSGRVVCVIDDDPSVREALASLFRSIGLEVVLFDAVTPFLRNESHGPVGCLVVDIRLPGIGGLQFQDLMARAGSTIPIVFMTGHGDVEMSVHAMKAGAVDFLEKPFRDQDILDAVAAALERDRRRRDKECAISALRAAFASLTPREKEVMAFVAAGLMNKQIASAMDLSEVTVKIHRGNLMRKIGARSLPDLVRMADTLVVQPRHVPGNKGRSGVVPLEMSV